MNNDFETNRGIGSKNKDASLSYFCKNVELYHNSKNPQYAIDEYIENSFRYVADRRSSNTNTTVSYSYWAKTNLSLDELTAIELITQEIKDNEYPATYTASQRLNEIRLTDFLRNAMYTPRRYNNYIYILQINEMSDIFVKFCETVLCADRVTMADNLCYITNANETIVLLRDCNIAIDLLEQALRKICNLPEEYGQVTRKEFTLADDEALRFNRHLCMNTIERQIDTLNTLCNRQRDFLTKYTQTSAQIRTEMTKLQSLKVDSMETMELYNTIKKCSIPYKLSYNIGTLELVVTTPLFNFDETLAAKSYDADTSNYTRDVMYMYKKCFVDMEWEIMTESRVTVNLIDNSVNRTDTCSEYLTDYMKSRNLTYIPNPHIQGYNCFGQNGPVLTKLLVDKKYEEFIYCLKATLGNLNFNDSVVKRHIFKYWWRDSKPTQVWCRNLETGELYTKGDILKLCDSDVV